LAIRRGRTRPGCASLAGPNVTDGGGEQLQIRVFVADDHPLYRQALVRVVSEHPQLDVVGDAPDAPQALRGILELSPNVALLDVRMPGDGVTVMRTLRGDGNATRVLFVSAYTEARDVYRAVAAGASGYLAKDASGEAICDAILAVAQGETRFSPSTEVALVSAVHEREEAARVHLSDRERQILKMVAEGGSNASVGDQLYLSSETVKTHLRSTFEKLQVADRTAAVAAAIRQGLIE
jgi:two-component system nitrate/nitrite response regulator NarL